MRSDLDQPVLARRRRWRRWLRIRIWLPVLVALALGLLFLRVATAELPVLQDVGTEPEDGWRVLEGAFHVRAGEVEDTVTHPVLRQAFLAGLEFVVLVDADLARVQYMGTGAPLAVIAGQHLSESWPQVVVITAGKERWSVALRVTSGPEGAESLKASRGLEFLNAEAQLSGAAWLTRIGRWIAMILGSDHSHIYLGERPIEGLAHWDDGNRKGQRLLGFCGLDASEGSRALMGALVTYVLVEEGKEPYTPEEIDAALRAGHHYCGLPFLGDPSCFRFEARMAGGRMGMMGDTIRLQSGLELVADLHMTSAVGVEIHLYLDGAEIHRIAGTRMAVPVKQPGAYRVEVTVIAPVMPWGKEPLGFIYSNPIFVVEES